MKKMRLDNKGSILVMVVAAVLVVTLMLTTLLTMSVNNASSRRATTISQEDFYSVETAMAELLTGLEELAWSSLENPYKELLDTYTSKNEEERKEAFYEEVSDKLYAIIKSNFVDNFYNGDDDATKLCFSSDKVAWKAVPVLSQSAEDKANGRVVLRGVALSYTDERGYDSTIVTDIEIELKYPDFKTSYTPGVQIPGITVSTGALQDFAIICDSQIKYGSAGSEASIIGNVYGGGYDAGTKTYIRPGFFCDNGRLKIRSNLLVSRYEIETKDTGRIAINGDSSSYSSVWLNGIRLSGDSSALASDALNFTASANCFVKDDLTVNAKSGRLSVVGNYYGYSIGDTIDYKKDGSAEVKNPEAHRDSSAIIINGSNSEVDLRSVSSLWLAGRAFITPRNYGGGGADGNNTVSVMQGESLAYKSSQKAYLISGDDIIGIGHNPMTVAEYTKLTTPVETGKKSDTYINLTTTLKTFVNESVPVIPAFVKYSGTGDDSTRVYLYLNFKGDTAEEKAEYAQKYFKQYREGHADEMNIYYEQGVGNIWLNEAGVTSYGDVLDYEENIYDPLEPKEQRFKDGQMDSATVEDFKTREAEYSETYKKLYLTLDSTYELKTDEEDYDPFAANENFTTDRYVNYGKVASDPVIKDAGVDGYGFIAVNHDYEHTPSSPYNKGIIISSGNVTVTADFTGSIFARGDVTIVGNNIAVMKGSSVDIAEILKKNLDYFRLDSDDGGLGAGGGSVGVGSNRVGRYGVSLTTKNWSKY